MNGADAAEGRGNARGAASLTEGLSENELAEADLERAQRSARKRLGFAASITLVVPGGFALSILRQGTLQIELILIFLVLAFGTVPIWLSWDHAREQAALAERRWLQLRRRRGRHTLQATPPGTLGMPSAFTGCDREASGTQ